MLHTLQGKQKYQVTNVGVKSKIVTFATSMITEFMNKNQLILLKLFWGLREYFYFLIKFLFTHILQTWNGPVDNHGRELSEP